MKLRIAIIHSKLFIGGAERVLINMLNVIDYSKYSIDLYLLEPLSQFEKGLEDCINSNVNTIYINNIRSSKIDPLFSHILYDCAIVYQGFSFGLIYENNRRLRAKKKVIWIHGSCSYLKWDPKTKNEFLKEYNQADLFFCVSKNVEQDFLEVFPSLKNKTKIFYNILDKEEITIKSKGESDISSELFSILSVGRISAEKGHILIPKAARLLLDSGYYFKWYILGDGDYRSDVESEMKKWKVENTVQILGYKSNPYPDIKRCNLLVLPSFTEGYCTVTMEALVLGKPIVATPVGGIFEQITDAETGIVAEGISSEDLFKSISSYLSNDKLRSTIIKNIEERSFDNRYEIIKLYDFIERSPSNSSICQKAFHEILLLDIFQRLFNKIKEKSKRLLGDIV